MFWEYSPVSVGVAETDKVKVSLYPNPFTDFLCVESEREGELLLFDIQGKVVSGARISASQNKIDLSGLPSGTYGYQIASGGKVFAKGRLVAQ